MLKRFFALGLALCCLLSAASAEKITLRLLDIQESSAYRRANPHIAFQEATVGPWDDALSWVENHKADVIYLRGYSKDVQTILARPELLADLSVSEGVTSALSRMMPWIQQLVTDQEGAIRALPLSATVRCFSWRQDAWDAAGLTAADVPQSYEELLNFLEAWCDRLEENPNQPVRVSSLLRWSTGTRKYDYCWWLTEMLLMCQVMQCRYAGMPVAFNTPEFIECAQRTIDVATRLYKSEPRGKRTENLPELFFNSLRAGRVFNEGRDYELSHAIPMRLSSDQPALIWGSVEMAVVPAASAQQEEALRFLEDRLQNSGWMYDVLLYSDFAPENYKSAGAINSVSEGWLKDYHSYAGTIYDCPNVFEFQRDSSTGKESLMMKYFKQDISAETFAQRLDKLLAE